MIRLGGALRKGANLTPARRRRGGAARGLQLSSAAWRDHQAKAARAKHSQHLNKKLSSRSFAQRLARWKPGSEFQAYLRYLRLRAEPPCKSGGSPGSVAAVERDILSRFHFCHNIRAEDRTSQLFAATYGRASGPTKLAASVLLAACPKWEVVDACTESINQQALSRSSRKGSKGPNVLNVEGIAELSVQEIQSCVDHALAKCGLDNVWKDMPHICLAQPGRSKPRQLSELILAAARSAQGLYSHLIGQSRPASFEHSEQLLATLMSHDGLAGCGVGPFVTYQALLNFIAVE